MKKILVSLNILLAIIFSSCQNQTVTETESGSAMDSLCTDIAAICESLDAEIGIAVLFDNGDSLSYGNSTHYPMLSVVKFPQALAVCNELGMNQQDLFTIIEVTPADLKPDTWSPMRDRIPQGGNFMVSDLLDYSLIFSDNNACDILFHKVCSMDKVQAFIRQIGIKDCDIQCDEQMMKIDLMNCYKNSCTPWAAVQLLEYLYQKKELGGYDYVWQKMGECQTGANRIPAGVADTNATIVHKTGTGPVLEDGRLMAINDIGTILLPDGSHVSIAVFIKDANLSMEEAEKAIAKITERIIKK